MSLKPLDQFDFDLETKGPERYFKFDLKAFENLLDTKNETFWQKEGEKQALKLFHLAARRVPAYKDFLNKNKIDPKTIKTISDFDAVPVTDKSNYINNYSIQERSWDGKLDRFKLIAVSSGTTGEPKFWARGDYQEFEAAVVHELIYKNSFQIDKHKTLLAIGFPMGVYVSGMATVLPSWLVALKGYPLTVVSVGNNKTEMLRIVEQMGRQYEQVILVGHPFFIKDVLETGKNNGIKWGKFKVRLMFCSQGFSEIWRDYVKKLIGSKDTSDLISVYGSSEMLLMGYESKLSINARQLFSSSQKLLQEIFHTNIAPNFFQYNPRLRYIESINHELIFTSASGLPLIRFNLHDQGQVISRNFVLNRLPSLTLPGKSWQLPFVALWGRSDQTLIFYAANIYPEHIQSALQQPKFLKKLTGKFAMRKGEFKNLDEFLEINIELIDKIKPNKIFCRVIQKNIIEKLSELNIEYRFLQEHLEKDLTPRINLWPYQSKKYFKPGSKPKYIIRT